jgi:hypothetical protein
MAFRQRAGFFRETCASRSPGLASRETSFAARPNPAWPHSLIEQVCSNRGDRVSRRAVLPVREGKYNMQDARFAGCRVIQILQYPPWIHQK